MSYTLQDVKRVREQLEKAMPFLEFWEDDYGYTLKAKWGNQAFYVSDAHEGGGYLLSADKVIKAFGVWVI